MQQLFLLLANAGPYSAVLVRACRDLIGLLFFLPGLYFLQAGRLQVSFLEMAME